MKTTRLNRSNRAAFTLIEIVIATSIAMVLLFGALYSTSETLEVVREGDIRVHTNINARRALDRMLKDCRYASEVEVEGDSLTSWTVEVETTGTMAPGEIEYTWNPVDKILRVGLEHGVAENLITDVRNFEVDTLTSIIDGEEVVTRIRFHLVIGLDDGFATGATSANSERTLELAGATWIRRNDI
jgi:type II secretory pathway pseudopilin PulG